MILVQDYCGRHLVSGRTYCGTSLSSVPEHKTRIVLSTGATCCSAKHISCLHLSQDRMKYRCVRRIETSAGQLVICAAITYPYPVTVVSQ